ncbi:unnamed protein product [Rotaria magnacalcarata]
MPRISCGGYAIEWVKTYKYLGYWVTTKKAFARLSHPKGSLDYKKMRNDIAANIRQGNLSYRTHGALLMNQNSNGENDAHNDEENNSDNDNDDEENNSDNDDDDEENESNNHVNDFQSRIRTIEVVDDSSNGEEE